jgi:hypothetical protein
MSTYLFGERRLIEHSYGPEIEEALISSGHGGMDFTLFVDAVFHLPNLAEKADYYCPKGSR